MVRTKRYNSMHFQIFIFHKDKLHLTIYGENFELLQRLASVCITEFMRTLQTAAMKVMLSRPDTLTATIIRMSRMS